MKTSIQVWNPHHTEKSMKHSKHSRRRARRNPTGKAALAAGGHTLGKVVAGVLTTAIGTRLLAMKKADGTPRLSPNAQLALQGGVAFAAAVGSSMVDNRMVGDVLEGTAVVMGGDAGLKAVAMYQIPERVQSLIPGQQPSPQLGAPAATNPGGYVYPQVPHYAS